MENERTISTKAIQRLTLYHCILSDALLEKEESISSRHIARLLSLDDSQVRKDVNLCYTKGKGKVGYNVAKLKRAIEVFLGFETSKDVFIIGAGNLGFALANYNDFKDYGLNVLALFDISPEKIGQIVNGKTIFHIDKVKNLVKKMKVEIVILTVPRSSAQGVADFLADSNIKYIWNFTTKILELPKSISVCNENLIGNFLNFTKERIRGSKD